jgi:hypothetical protein
MKLLIIILTITLFVSCGTDKDDEQPQIDTKNDDISQRIDSDEISMDSAETGLDSTSNPNAPPQKSPLLQDESNKSISELWNTYKRAKNNVSRALDSNDIDAIVSNLALAGESAEQLGRMDIASWQFNNIGHYSIVEFKRRTDYDERLQNLATMLSGTEKTGYLQATKDLFMKEYPLLKKAKDYLVRAQIIDDFLDPSRRTDVIQRNIDYVEWVKKFTGVEDSI